MSISDIQSLAQGGTLALVVAAIAYLWKYLTQKEKSTEATIERIQQRHADEVKRYQDRLDSKDAASVGMADRLVKVIENNTAALIEFRETNKAAFAEMMDCVATAMQSAESQSAIAQRQTEILALLREKGAE